MKQELKTLKFAIKNSNEHIKSKNLSPINQKKKEKDSSQIYDKPLGSPSNTSFAKKSINNSQTLITDKDDQ